MSCPNITIKNYGNIYFCCKCLCVCGKECKCEVSRCSLAKINENSEGKVMIGKKSSEKSTSMKASKEQIERSMIPPHGMICLDCKGGCEDDKKMVSGSRSKRSKRSSSKRQSEKRRTKTDGSTKTQESMDIFFLQKKRVELKAKVDGASIYTTVTLNVKTKNKDAKIEMEEMWVDGERFYSKKNTKN